MKPLMKIQGIENEMDSELRFECGFAQMPGGVRDKYAERCWAGTNLLLLDGGSLIEHKAVEERANRPRDCNKDSS